MGIFQKPSHVSTILWLYHQDFNGDLREKSTGDLNKDAACRINQILEAAPHKTSAVQPLTSDLQ